MSDLKTGVQRNIKQTFSTAYVYTATILSLLLITWNILTCSCCHQQDRNHCMKESFILTNAQVDCINCLWCAVDLVSLLVILHTI